MIVWPGLRRSVSAISRLFNSAAFDAPLTHSAIPTRAASGTTATFTRATTKTWSNNDGYLVTGLAGEIGFPGARRVDNLIRLGAAQSSTLAVAANVTMTLPAGAYQFSMGAGTGTATFSGTGGATGTLAASASARTFVAKTISAGTLIVTASVATLVDIQVVSMVAETDQTTEREYVSIGVESAPYYHGSFVDGVKCFATDINGAAIPSTTLLGYLAEGARTNLIVRSNELDNASWTKNNATISANGAVASDGTTSLDKIVEAAATSIHSVYQTIAGTSGSYTVSVEMKQAERTWGFITEGNSVTATAYFNLAAGTVGTVSGTGSPSATITALANGAYRCTMTFTAGANANCQFGPATGNGSASYAGDITKGIYAGMVGFENNAFASSYIATTTIAVARNADVLTYSSAGNVSATAGWVYAEFGEQSPGGGAAVREIVAIATDANNTIRIEDNSAGSVRLVNVTGGSIDVNSTLGAITAGWVMNKVAASYATNNYKGTLNTNAVVSDTSATVPAFTTIYVGDFAGSGGALFGTIRNVRIGQRALSSSELQAVTA